MSIEDYKNLACYLFMAWVLIHWTNRWVKKPFNLILNFHQGCRCDKVDFGKLPTGEPLRRKTHKLVKSVSVKK